MARTRTSVLARRASVLAALVGSALACGGGQTLPDGPIGTAPVARPVAEAPAPIEIVPTGDAVLDAYQADCHAILAPGDLSRGDDECRAIDGFVDLPADPYGCSDRAALCGSGCGARCGECQEQCASDCDLCRSTCQDAECVRFCAEGRATCRLLCMRSQSECARVCLEGIASCEVSAGAQRDIDCPRCEQIRLCFEDRDRYDVCRERYPDEDERCFTWCRP